MKEENTGQPYVSSPVEAGQEGVAGTKRSDWYGSETGDTAAAKQSNATEATNEARRRGRESVEAMRRRGEEYADSRKEYLASVVDDIRKSIEYAAEKLEGEKHDALASYARKTAENVNSFSHSLREKSSSEIIRNANSSARRKPELVIGGMFLAGLAAARFIRAGETKEYSH